MKKEWFTMKVQFATKLQALLLALTASIFAAALAVPALGNGNDQPDHIYFIMMENHATNQIIGNTSDAPFINRLAHRYNVAANYHGVTHPSLPNYLAAISGDFQGIWDDCKAGATVTCGPEEFVAGAGDATDATSSVYTDPKSPLFGLVPPQLTQAQVTSSSAQPHWFSGQTIVDVLESKGLTWKAYMQSLPFAGADVEYWPTYEGTTFKLYAQKHDPFMYFANIRNSTSRTANNVPLTQLDYDLATNSVPNFAWISPDQCNDMHGVGNGSPLGYPTCSYPASGLDHGAIQLGDAFLQQTVTKIMNSPAWSKDSIIVIAWDEDDYNGYPVGCCFSPTGTTGTYGNVLGGAITPAIVISPNTPAHRVSTRPYNHYTLLGTILKLWNLPCLGNTCKLDHADLMWDMFENKER
jgi:phosphatidylinositol-3-phosphatase